MINKIVITKTSIIKIKSLNVQTNECLGFNLKTECLEKHNLNDCSIIRDGIIDVLNDQKVRFLIAKQMVKSQKKAITELSTILDCSDRTVFRLKERYDFAEEEPILDEL
jgi:hypothetical protein